MNLLISFVVPTIERDVTDLCKLLDSYLDMDSYHQTEMIIISDKLSQESKQKINKKIKRYENIKLYIINGCSRCEAKEFGIQYSITAKIAYIDSDCTFNKDYMTVLYDYLNYKIIRGKNIYVPDQNWISKQNSIYRTLCDEKFFKDQTFTPNLIINKAILTKVGGWSNNNNNMDSADDYNFSQRLKQMMTVKIKHINAVLYCNNNADKSFKKLIKTWYGYGLGYGFRFWHSKNINRNTFIKNIPPLVYSFKYGISYFSFSLCQWTITFCGYIRGLIRYKIN